MALTFGDGPWSDLRAGSSPDRFPDHVLYLAPVGRRVRAEFAGMTVLRTDDAQVLFETGVFQQRYVPREDIAEGVLQPSRRRKSDAHKGEAAYEDLVVGDRRVPDAAWSYPEAGPHAPERLAGLVAFEHDALDRWFEEDEELLGHPRDPFHRVDTRRSSRTVEVRINGDLVARSDRPVALFETSIPVRWYVPREDVLVEMSLSATTNICPYKGVASYWSYGHHSDIAWSYEQPLGEALSVPGHVSFDGEGVEISVS